MSCGVRGRCGGVPRVLGYCSAYSAKLNLELGRCAPGVKLAREWGREYVGEGENCGVVARGRVLDGGVWTSAGELARTKRGDERL